MFRKTAIATAAAVVIAAAPATAQAASRPSDARAMQLAQTLVSNEAIAAPIMRPVVEDLAGAKLKNAGGTAQAVTAHGKRVVFVRTLLVGVTETNEMIGRTVFVVVRKNRDGSVIASPLA
jgi:hypothetical protein